MRADTADEFGACSCRQKDGSADMIEGKTNGNGDLFEVHTDERTADIKSCVGADLLYRDGVFKMSISRGRKRAACLGLGNDVNDVCKGNSGFFNEAHLRCI